MLMVTMIHHLHYGRGCDYDDDDGDYAGDDDAAAADNDDDGGDDDGGDNSESPTATRKSPTATRKSTNATAHGRLLRAAGRGRVQRVRGPPGTPTYGCSKKLIGRSLFFGCLVSQVKRWDGFWLDDFPTS